MVCLMSGEASQRLVRLAEDAPPPTRDGRSSEGWRALDVGSASRVHVADDRPATIIALDLSFEQLSRLGQRSARGDPIVAVQADATSLPFPDEVFDSVGLFEVLEHVASPERVLAECWRVLHAGAPLTVSVPTSYSERVYWRLHPRYRSQSTHLRIFERHGLVDLLEGSGYKVDRVETRHLAPMVSWFVHCLLHSPADHTGAVLRNQWVDTVVGKVIGGARRTPALGAAVRAASKRWGKSWWFFCVKVPPL